MQLPSVLDSAEVMKSCVSFLEPYLDKREGATRGRVVLATVKGDVHDIGKNLVDIILSNNGYQVINLGIKQPSDRIIAAALEHRADAIGLSGLLVKSTVEMKHVVEDLASRGLSFPVLCGGAALTRRFVEQDLRKIYQHGVFYGEDAFAGLRIMEELLDPHSRAQKLAEGRTAPEPASESEPLEEADESPSAERLQTRDGRLYGKSDHYEIPTPPFWGVRVVSNINLEEVFRYVNHTALFKGQWQIRGLSRKEFARVVRERYLPILRELQAEIIREGHFTPRAVYGYFPCQSEGDDLILYDPGGEPICRFSFPRQRKGNRLCLADYFLPKESGLMDVVALQLVTIGPQASEISREYFAKHLYTKYLYFHGLSVESAEALAELVHKRIREELGIAGDDAPEVEQLFRQQYRGRRFSFGYGACPDLADQEKLLRLLDAEKTVGVTLTSGYQLEPEQSTSALVVHHPRARYFNV